MTDTLHYTPIDEEWKNIIKSLWWATQYEGTLQDIIGASYQITCPQYFNDKSQHLTRLFALRDKILTFGGEEVCLPRTEDDLDAIESDSQFWYGHNVMLRKGQPSHCHQNIACQYLGNPKHLKICTGYALTDDGIWRQHTWGLFTYKTKPDLIVESTIPRLAYYGVVLTDEQAKQFVREVLE